MHPMMSFILVVLVAFSGCGQSVGEDRPQHSIPVAIHLHGCYRDYYWYGTRCELYDLECEVDPTSPACQIAADCPQANTVSFQNCLKSIPTQDLACREALEVENLFYSEKDSDGDGVQDRFEIPLELDPCNPCTYPTGPCDGELDSDGNGLPNSDPNGPGCGDNCYM